MRTVHAIAELRAQVATWKRAGERVAFVPTMGNLHRGHIHLVERASRPTHFSGVTTVVSKLFNMARPDVAVFGEKDWQQLVIIRRMAADLDMPVEIVGVPTVRESDGLALSSRNGYLSAEQRAVAPTLYATLRATAERLRAGERDFAVLETGAKAKLAAVDFRPDYFEIRRPHDLQPPTIEDTALRIFAAAWLGRTRLIDNLPVELN